MPDSSKDRDHVKYSPSSSRFGVGRETNNSTPENFTATKPTAHIENHGLGEDSRRGLCSQERRRKLFLLFLIWSQLLPLPTVNALPVVTTVTLSSLLHHVFVSPLYCYY